MTLRSRDDRPGFPQLEHYYVVAPAVVEDKARPASMQPGAKPPNPSSCSEKSAWPRGPAPKSAPAPRPRHIETRRRRRLAAQNKLGQPPIAQRTGGDNKVEQRRLHTHPLSVGSTTGFYATGHRSGRRTHCLFFGQQAGLRDRPGDPAAPSPAAVVPRASRFAAARRRRRSRPTRTGTQRAVARRPGAGPRSASRPAAGSLTPPPGRSHCPTCRPAHITTTRRRRTAMWDRGYDQMVAEIKSRFGFRTGALQHRRMVHGLRGPAGGQRRDLDFR